jgi:hypothetical protein
MMERLTTGQMIPLMGDDAPPRVGELSPDVRSGTTFTYDGSGGATDPIQFVIVAWIYTVEFDQRPNFAQKIENFEDDIARLPAANTGVAYRGTYSVSISSALLEYEYRTFWGLEHLGRLRDLNDYLRRAPQNLKDAIGLISKKPPLRSEIMGLTRASAPLGGSTA